MPKPHDEVNEYIRNALAGFEKIKSLLESPHFPQFPYSGDVVQHIAEITTPFSKSLDKFLKTRAPYPEEFESNHL